LTNRLEIDDSTFIKIKRVREIVEENNDWNSCNQLKRWEEGEEEEQKEKEEEEEEEEEEEAAFPHPSACCGFTWETIEESLKEGTLPSTLYNELPPQTYFAFMLSILEGHVRYLKRVDHLNSQQIENSDEM
jgi:hypothetical protein